MNDEDTCLADSATTHSILQNAKYFTHLEMTKANVNTISGSANLIEGFGRAIIVFSNGTKLCIDDARKNRKQTVVL